MHIEPGKYKAQCVAYEYAETSTGKTHIAARFEVETNEGKKKITWMGYFTEKTRKRTFESLKHMGWDGKTLSDLGPLTLNVELDIVADEYLGKVRSKVAWVNALGGSVKTGRILNESEIQRFAASMQRHIAAVSNKEEDDIGW